MKSQWRSRTLLHFVLSWRIDDLWNKCTKFQKYESETEHKIRALLDAVEEKDTEIENLHKHLARYTTSFYFTEGKIIYLFVRLISKFWTFYRAPFFIHIQCVTSLFVIRYSIIFNKESNLRAINRSVRLFLYLFDRTAKQLLVKNMFSFFLVNLA